MFRSFLASCVLCALVAALPVVAVASPIELSAVTVHLFLDGTGEFTSDVTDMKGFGARNFRPFADGQDFGANNFHSLLVKILFTAPVETLENGRVAELTVSNVDTGKIILRRTISGVYVGANGRTTIPILLSGHECDALQIVVKSSTTTIRKHLAFRCAE